MLQTLALLVAAHFVADYPLQGDFLSKAKAAGPLRIWHLFGHSAIQGACVGLVTGSLALGLAETAAHTMIDDAKVRGWTSFAQDQALHMLCKVVWIAGLWWGPA